MSSGWLTSKWQAQKNLYAHFVFNRNRATATLNCELHCFLLFSNFFLPSFLAYCMSCSSRHCKLASIASEKWERNDFLSKQDMRDIFLVRTVLLYILIGGTWVATNDCVVFWQSMGTTVFIYSCVSNPISSVICL